MMQELTFTEFLAQFGNKFSNTKIKLRKATGRWPPRLAEFDENVHKQILTVLLRADVDAVVMFENPDMWSSQFGARTVIIVGPGCTYKTVEECNGRHLHCLPSERQYACTFYRKRPDDMQQIDLSRLVLMPPVPPRPLPPPKSATKFVGQGMAKQVSQWLRGVQEVLESQAVRVTIDGTAYEGARYKQQFEPLPGARSQKPYVHEAIYLIGKLVKKDRTCFRFEGEDRDWYLSGYFDAVEAITRDEVEQEQHHPFGAFFMLAPWDVPDGSLIDTHEQKKYARLMILVEEL